MTVSSFIEQVLFAGTNIRTEIVKGLFEDEIVEQEFYVYVLLD